MKATFHSSILILLALFLFTGCKEEDNPLHNGAVNLTIRLTQQNLDFIGKTTFQAGDIFNYTLTTPDREEVLAQGVAIYNGQELITDATIYLREEALLTVEYPETDSNTGYRATATVSPDNNMVYISFSPYAENARIELLIYGYTPEELEKFNTVIKINGKDVSQNGIRVGEKHTLFVSTYEENDEAFDAYYVKIGSQVFPPSSAADFKTFYGGNYAFAFAVPTGQPIPVWSTTSLENIWNNLSGNYIQICDIKLSTRCPWQPIGDSKYYSFSGTYDGGGYMIDYAMIDQSNSKIGGIFGFNEGKLSNIRIGANSIIKGNSGGICGQNNGTITRCHNEGFIEGDGSGGICGFNSGYIYNSSNSGKILSENGYLGGICGYNSGYIYNCFNNGEILSQGGSIGGICGQNRNLIFACYNTGIITGGKEYVGGICGYNTHASIINCYNTGTAKGTDYVGGICGNNEQSVISASYNVGKITGNGGNIGGICGYTENPAESIYQCYYTGPTDDKYAFRFSGTHWPSIETAGWGDTPPENWTVSQYGEWICSWQNDLGGWNGGNPIYPKLRWEK